MLSLLMFLLLLVRLFLILVLVNIHAVVTIVRHFLIVTVIVCLSLYLSVCVCYCLFCFIFNSFLKDEPIQYYMWLYDFYNYVYPALFVGLSSNGLLHRRIFCILVVRIFGVISSYIRYRT